MKVVGVDFGGTTMTIGLVDVEKGIISSVKLPTLADTGFYDITERMAKAINEMKSDSVAVGIGSPGSIIDGVVLFSPNLPDWRNVPLAKRIEDLTGLPTFVENDANAFVLGEKWFGAGKGKEHIVGLTLGTGVGSGVITHGVLLKGHKGIGAELGHVVVRPGGPFCGCGNYGCLETLASATAIVRMAREGRVKYPDSIIFKNKEITAKVVMDSAKKGDFLALKIRNVVVEALAQAIAGFIHIFNPEVVIIGGGVSKAGEILFKPLREKVNDLVMPSFRDTFEILQSPLGDDAAVYGAAAIALESMGVR